MSKRPITIALVILLVAAVSVVGYLYIGKMPQVSGNESKNILEEYKAGLEGAYAELNDAYDRLAVERNTVEWQNFSKEWIPKLSKARPEDINKRLPNEYEGKKNVLVATQSAILSLWSEYNKDFTEDARNEQEIEELKSRIEQTFKSLDI
ncbi:MAG: hypothetical protein HPY66_1628 [Firmicutes bacterium]|nr:hypothetical protein [Bacillota bacterium]